MPTVGDESTTNTPSLEDVMNAVDVPEEQPETTAAPDPVKNIKAEFARKQANTEAALANTQAQLNELMNMLQSQNAAKNQKSIKDQLYDAPEQFAADVEARAVQKATEIVSKQVQASQALQQTVAEVTSKYKEFSDAQSEASQLAISKLAKMPAHMKNSAEGARLAMLEAAADLALTPASKRGSKDTSGDYVSGGSSSKGGSSGKTKSREETLQNQFAELLSSGVSGLDQKEFSKNFEKAQKRTKWSDPQ